MGAALKGHPKNIMFFATRANVGMCIWECVYLYIYMYTDVSVCINTHTHTLLQDLLRSNIYICVVSMNININISSMCKNTYARSKITLYETKPDVRTDTCKLL